MAVPLHSSCCSDGNRNFLMHWFAANTAWQKSHKNKDQKEEKGRKYTLYCGVTKVTPQIRPVIHLQPLLYPVTSRLVLQVKEALHYPGRSLCSTETTYRCTR